MNTRLNAHLISPFGCLRVISGFAHFNFSLLSNLIQSYWLSCKISLFLRTFTTTTPSLSRFIIIASSLVSLFPTLPAHPPRSVTSLTSATYLICLFTVLSFQILQAQFPHRTLLFLFPMPGSFLTLFKSFSDVAFALSSYLTHYSKWQHPFTHTPCPLYLLYFSPGLLLPSSIPSSLFFSLSASPHYIVKRH